MTAFSSRTVSLTVEAGSGELGRKNRDEQALRKIITSQSYRECRFTGTVRGVHYGTYNEKQATLVLLRFAFHSPLLKEWRFTSATITLKFKPMSKEHRSGKTADPYISLIFPYTVFGQVSAEQREWNMELAATLGTPGNLPVAANLAPKVSQDSSYSRDHSMKIQGFIYPENPYQDKENVARWDMIENDLQKSGIPHDFCCGVVVVHDEPHFQAEVKVRFSFPFSSGWKFTGSPWTKDEPLLFDSSQPLTELDQLYLAELRKIVNGRDLSALTELEYKSFAGFSNESDVNPLT